MNFLNTGILGFIYWLNNFFNDFGITIIVFTFILKVILLPIDFLAFLEEIKLQRLRPKIKEILKTTKNDILKKSDLLTEVYKQEKYNPFFTLTIQLLPLPILFAIFFSLNKIAQSSTINLLFLNSINLGQRNFLLSTAVGAVQLLTILNLPADQRKIALFFFGLIVVILYQFSALLNLYWLVHLLLTLGERAIFKTLNKNSISK